MTCEEFIRNNRGINAGENLPQDFLRALYESISRNEIRISSEASVSASPVLWTQLAQASVSPRGFMLEPDTLGESCLPLPLCGNVTFSCKPLAFALKLYRHNDRILHPDVKFMVRLCLLHDIREKELQNSLLQCQIVIMSRRKQASPLPTRSIPVSALEVQTAKVRRPYQS